MSNEICAYCEADLGCEFNSIRAREYFVLKLGWASCDACLLREADEFAGMGDARLVALRLFYVHHVNLQKIDAAIKRSVDFLKPGQVAILHEKRAEILELHAAGERIAAMRAGLELFALTGYVATEPERILGKKMSAGRKLGTVGPVRKAVAKYLTRHPSAKNDEIWGALKEKPPRGWTFMDNSLGRYIEGPKADREINFPRFRNICSEERRQLKG